VGQAVSVLIELEAGFCFLPDALSSRDPLSTLRENAMAAMRSPATLSCPTRAQVVIDPLASGTRQSVALKVEILFAGRYAHVANQHVHPSVHINLDAQGFIGCSFPDGYLGEMRLVPYLRGSTCQLRIIKPLLRRS
jgi:hypothetical protein